MRLRSRAAAALAAAALSGGLIMAVSTTTAEAAPSGLSGDFNGDGYRDIAVGAPGATIGGAADAGYAAVVYGSATGLNQASRTVISQATAGIPGSPEAGDLFGDRITTGDLDGDGYTDLIIGTAHEKLGSTSRYGQLTVVWGGSGGLSGSTVITASGVTNPYGAGVDLATGDFDGDGTTDLATLSYDNPSLSIHHGPFSRAGVADSLETRDVEATVEGPTRLVAGLINGDKASDLVVQGNGTDASYPKTLVLLGSAEGVGAHYARTIAPGWDAAIGDVDNDGYGDIVTGQWYDAGGDSPSLKGGSITLTFGSADGVSASRRPIMTGQDSPGIPGIAESQDRFGWTVSTGDTNGDGYADVAIGARWEDVGQVKEAGSVTVLHGSSTGFTGTGAKLLTQNVPNVPGTDEAGDRFGSFVQLSDINGDKRTELVAAAVGENKFNGAVWQFRTTTGGITPTSSIRFSGGTLGAPTTSAKFGFRLAG